MYNKRFVGKVAIITGAGKGIGKATSIRLSNEGCGIVAVSISDSAQSVVDTINHAGGQAIFVQADVSKEEQAAQVVQLAMNNFGRIDHLFNNAGITGVHNTPVRSYDSEEFYKVLSTNLLSQFFFMKHVLPHMSEGSSVLNCSSLHGNIGMAYDAAYSASKHAIIGLTKSAALEEGVNGIRINSICPGAVPTELMESYIKRSGQDRDVAWRAVTSMNPLKRSGTPDEIANLAAFMLSHEASFITGATYIADGGHFAG